MAATDENLARYQDVSEEWNLTGQALRFDRIIEVLRAERATVPWLEFGALSGGFAAQCADALQLERAKMWCCDFVRSHLQRATERGFQTAVWDLEGGSRPRELRPASFQTIVFSEIIEHLVAPDKALGPVVELLAPGGLLLVTTPNLASFGNRIRMLLGRTPSLGPAPGTTVKAPGSLAALDHLRVCVADEWVFLLESLGLKVTKVEGCTSAPRGPYSPLRRRLSVALNVFFERLPGHLYQNTLIVARKP